MTNEPNYASEIKALHSAAFLPKGAIIAGGAVTSVFTNKPINDVDVYFKSQAHFEGAIESAYEDGYWCADVSKRSVTFKDGDTIIQYMHFDFFPTANDIFKAFDFTVCMGAYDYEAREMVLHPDFLKHNSQRFLRFNPGTNFPLASATRVIKYQDRGYTIGKGDILKIALACRKVDINSWADLKDQIGGAYGYKVELAKISPSRSTRPSTHLPSPMMATTSGSVRLTTTTSQAAPWSACARLLRSTALSSMRASLMATAT